MRSLFIGLATLWLSGCASTGTGTGDAPFELVWIESPRFCQGETRSYSDFAYIRPSQETIIGNRCGNGEDTLGDGPVVWVTVPGWDGWQPPADREQRLTYEQRFKKGSAAMPNSHEGLARLLEVAKAHPDRPIRIVGSVATGERDDVGRRRAQAVKAWLVKSGVNPERMSIGPSDRGAPVAQSEITIIVRG